MKAARNGHLEALCYLVEQGSDKDKTTNNGWTALMTAAHHGHFGVVEFLL